MNEKIKEYIKKYIKENLDVSITTVDKSDYRGNGYIEIHIETKLGKETVSNDYDTISL